MNEDKRTSADAAAITAIHREGAARRAASLATAKRELRRMPKTFWPTKALLATHDDVRIANRAGLAATFDGDGLTEVAAAMRAITCRRDEIVLVAIGETSGVSVVALDLLRGKQRSVGVVPSGKE